MFRHSNRYQEDQEDKAYLQEKILESENRRSSEFNNSEDFRCSSGIAVSYNDNNLLEKEMDDDKSKLVKERLLNNRYKQSSNDGLTHLMLTAEDRVRVKKYEPRNEFLPVYKDKITEDNDEDNYTSNLDSPGMFRKWNKTIVILPGSVLAKIQEYYGGEGSMHSLWKGIYYKLRIFSQNYDESEIQLPFENSQEEVEDGRENENF